MSLVKPLSVNKIEGLILQVIHSEYGVLFAAMIRGKGELITKNDEEGYEIPFLTTEEILKQIAKFGFYVKYDEKSNLPDKTLNFIQQMMLLGYDKITRVLLQTINKYNETIWKPSILIYKSAMNEDLLAFDIKLTRTKYMKKVDRNSVVNVTDEDINWDWVTTFYGLSDIMDENLDMPDEYETETDVHEGNFHPIDPVNTDPDTNLVPEGFTLYGSEEVEGDENGTE